MKIKIQSAGPLTTVQDQGRYGYMKYGITSSGVMDERAYLYGNMLVGNDNTRACLEMTVKGITAQFEGAGFIALVGAKMPATLNGTAIANNQKIAVQNGDILECGFASAGLRTYLFCYGGIDVPVVYGSRSTNLKCGLGGFEGRKLQDGDILQTEEAAMEYDIPSCRDYSLPEGDAMNIRVMFGPQDDFFTENGIHSLTQGRYQVSPQSDRMGIRLTGTSLEAEHGMDIISDAIPVGSIQVASDGQPIILLADRQTTGGYAKIATVIRADLWKLAQARPGTYVTFEAVSGRQARKIWKREW